MIDLKKSYDLLKRIDEKNYNNEKEHKDLLNEVKGLFNMAANEEQYSKFLKNKLKEKEQELTFYKEEISKFINIIIRGE